MIHENSTKTADCPMCCCWHDDADLQVVELEQSYVVLNRDQFFPGYTVLFTRRQVTELFHLEQSVRSALMEEVSMVAKALSTTFNSAKINYELLGNMVPHIHWHIVPRFISEPLWPRPIWAAEHDQLLLTPGEYRQRIGTIRKALL